MDISRVAASYIYTRCSCNNSHAKNGRQQFRLLHTKIHCSMTNLFHFIHKNLCCGNTGKDSGRHTGDITSPTKTVMSFSTTTLELIILEELILTLLTYMQNIQKMDCLEIDLYRYLLTLECLSCISKKYLYKV